MRTVNFTTEARKLRERLLSIPDRQEQIMTLAGALRDMHDLGGSARPVRAGGREEGATSKAPPEGLVEVLLGLKALKLGVNSAINDLKEVG